MNHLWKKDRDSLGLHAILNGLIILLARPNNRHRSRRSTLSESYIQKKWGSRFRNFLCTKKRLLFYDWHFLRVDRIPWALSLWLISSMHPLHDETMYPWRPTNDRQFQKNQEETVVSISQTGTRRGKVELRFSPVPSRYAKEPSLSLQRRLLIQETIHSHTIAGSLVDSLAGFCVTGNLVTF